MRKARNSRGIAIVLVLALAMALLIFGVTYMKSISQSTVVNPDLLLRAQIDILGEGIANIALLKFKELPSDFYYSYYKGRVADTTLIGPINTFEGDALLSGEITNFNGTTDTASFTTRYQVLSQKKYDTDTLVVTVTLGFRGMTREIRKTINTARKRLF